MYTTAVSSKDAQKLLVDETQPCAIIKTVILTDNGHVVLV